MLSSENVLDKTITFRQFFMASVLSDGLWEDLEKISLPSLPFQLGFPDSDVPLHCEDEADLLPVLNLD